MLLDEKPIESPEFRPFAAATGDGIVQVAYLHREVVSHSWKESMRQVREHDLNSAVTDGVDLGQAIRHGYRVAAKPLNLRCGAGLVAQIRNYGARLFLDKTVHEWLLFIDTDMGFADNSIYRLLDEAAHPVERPVVGALCFAHMEFAYDGMSGWRRSIVPTMYKLGKAKQTGEPSFCYYGDYPPDQVVQVAGTGGAFLLIHRTVLEKLRAEHGDNWFGMFYDHAGDIVGEDIAFCGRVLKAGIIPVVHTGVKTTHHKDIFIGEEDYEAQRAVTVAVNPDLPPHIDLGASFQTLLVNDHDHDGMLKLPADLDRYRAIIEATKPEVIVETGTNTGASARWFADRGCDVITIDVDPASASGSHEDGLNEYSITRAEPGAFGTIAWIKGDSADPANVAGIAAMVGHRRCMVSLDSDHSAAHVAREIQLYGPLVSPGCYLVVEDTIFGHTPPALLARHFPGGLDGSPLDAVADELLDNPDWSRDISIERMSTVSHHPAGFWLRNG